MIEIFNSILDFIVAIGNFLLNTILSLFSFIRSIPQYIDFLSTTIGVLPAWLLPFMVAGISLTVIAMLIRRSIL